MRVRKGRLRFRRELVYSYGSGGLIAGALVQGLSDQRDCEELGRQHLRIKGFPWQKFRACEIRGNSALISFRLGRMSERELVDGVRLVLDLENLWKSVSSYEVGGLEKIWVYKDYRLDEIDSLSEIAVLIEPPRVRERSFERAYEIFELAELEL